MQLAEPQVYVFAPSPVFTGKFDVETLMAMDFSVAMSVIAQVLTQTRSMRTDALFFRTACSSTLMPGTAGVRYFLAVSSTPDFAPAYVTSVVIGLALIASGVTVLLDFRGAGQRWTEWIYVHAPGGGQTSDAAFARARVRYRVYSILAIALGALCVYSSVSDIFFP